LRENTGALAPAHIGHQLFVKHQFNETFCHLLNLLSTPAATQVSMTTLLQDRQMDSWMGGWMDVWMDGWMGGWVDGWMGGWMGGWVDGWVGGWMDGWMGGWVGGWVDGWVDGWMGGWMGVLASDCGFCNTRNQSTGRG
jgi:hypothetical protein